MSYIGLGTKVALGIKDPTGLNTGNFTNVFDLAKLGAKVPYYEIYKVTVANGFQVVDLLWYQNNRKWSSITLSGNAEWDPVQPLLMTPNDETYFCWAKTYSSAITPVEVTVWMRYDPAINPNPAPRS